MTLFLVCLSKHMDTLIYTYIPFPYDFIAYDLVKTRLTESRVEPWISQPQCMFPHFFVIGLVSPLLLVTPTTQFSLDHKQHSGMRNQNTVFTRSKSSTLLITTLTLTLTPSLVKISLKRINTAKVMTFTDMVLGLL